MRRERPTTSRVLLAWSSGKDSAWALGELQRDRKVEVVGLLTTLNRRARRVSMHGVRRDLVRAQSLAVGLPLVEVELPAACSNADYERAMRRALLGAIEDGVTGVAFGDLFLEDVRRYREERMAEVGLEPLFPLWGRDTGRLAWEMVESGVGAFVTCVDPKALDPAFAGRAYDRRFLDDLPGEIDPCGERGEFHTFAFAGPGFAKPIEVTRGTIVRRGGFVFADLRPLERDR